jgi:hypothetical protein
MMVIPSNTGIGCAGSRAEAFFFRHGSVRSALAGAAADTPGQPRIEITGPISNESPDFDKAGTFATHSVAFERTDRATQPLGDVILRIKL